jgi:putative transposase
MHRAPTMRDTTTNDDGDTTDRVDGGGDMKYNPEIHHRRSIRLPGYDYGQAGLYFITICAWQRQCIFGTIEDGEMHLNPVGEIARDEWLRTAKIRPNIDIAEFVVMPNHVHGIIAIGDDPGVADGGGTRGRGTMHRAPTHRNPTAGRAHTDDDGDINDRVDDGAPHPRIEKFGKPTSNTIPTIVRGYKAAVTTQVNILRNSPQCPVWQRNYYEHIVRSEADYLRIAAYILNNPRQWQEDSLNDGK